MDRIDRRTALGWLKALPGVVLAPILTAGEVLAAKFPTRTVEKDTFRFDPSTGTIHWTASDKREPYRLVIDGMVEKSIELSYQDLRKLPAVARKSDFHCVEGWTIPDVTWSGIRFSEILKLVQLKKGAQYAVFHALGETRSAPEGQTHYLDSLKISDLIDPEQDMLLALDKDGKPLSHDRGAPLRVIAPFRLAYKMVKFVHRIEFVDKQKPGWWTLAASVYDWKALVPGHRLRKRSPR